MIAESVDHAFEDMSERVWTETSIKSNELLPAVKSAMTLVGDQLTQEDRQQIESLVKAVNEALDSKDTQRLKSANAALDQGTQHLATLLIDRAMSEAEKRQSG
jgi:molecular chaperone DnaK